MKTRFVPGYQEAKSLVSEGIIGELECLETSFAVKLIIIRILICLI